LREEEVIRLAAFSIFIIGVLVALSSAKEPPQRHHIYYCMSPYGIAMPCMYRKNTPVPV
jgi:hypothetical protein